MIQVNNISDVVGEGRYIRAKAVIETKSGNNIALKEFPISSVTVDAKVGIPASANISIPATFHASSLETRCLVFVFYNETDNNSDSYWKCLFVGTLISKSIVHGTAGRHISLLCSDLYAFISSIYLYQQSFMSGNDFLFNYGVIEGGTDQAAINNMADANAIELSSSGQTGYLTIDEQGINDWTTSENQEDPPPPAQVNWPDNEPIYNFNFTSRTWWTNLLSSFGVSGSTSIYRASTDTMDYTPATVLNNQSMIAGLYKQLTPEFTSTIDSFARNLGILYGGKIFIVDGGEVVDGGEYISESNSATEVALLMARTYPKYFNPGVSNYIGPPDEIILYRLSSSRVFSLTTRPGELYDSTNNQIDTTPSNWGLGAVIALHFRLSTSIQSAQARQLMIGTMSGSGWDFTYIKDSEKLEGDFISRSYYVSMSNWQQIVDSNTFSPYTSKISEAVGMESGAVLPWIRSFAVGTPGGLGQTLMQLLSNCFSAEEENMEVSVYNVVARFLKELVSGGFVNPYTRYELFRTRVLHSLGGLDKDPYAEKFFNAKYESEVHLKNAPAVLGGITNVGEVLRYALDEIFYTYVPCPTPGKVNGKIPSMLFLPKMYFQDPPRCNFIGEKEYYQFSYDRHTLTEVTRLGVIILPQISFQGSATVPIPTAIAGTTVVAPTYKFGNPPSAEKLREIHEHEQMTGIVPDWMKIDKFLPKQAAMIIQRSLSPSTAPFGIGESIGGITSPPTTMTRTKIAEGVNAIVEDTQITIYKSNISHIEAAETISEGHIIAVDSLPDLTIHNVDSLSEAGEDLIILTVNSTGVTNAGLSWEIFKQTSTDVQFMASSTPGQPTAGDFLSLALAQRGDRYILRTHIDINDPDPDNFDCSRLTRWAAGRLGIKLPDTAQAQYRYLRREGYEIPMEQALHIPGALVFKYGTGRHRPVYHVGISMGDGETIMEAKGSRWGVNTFPIRSWARSPDEGLNRWNLAGLIPGLNYGSTNVTYLRGATYAGTPQQSTLSDIQFQEPTEEIKNLTTKIAVNQADYEFLVRRYLGRMGQVLCPFNPEVILGFPVKVEARFDDRVSNYFIGYIDSLQHTIDLENGKAFTTLNLNMIRSEIDNIDFRYIFIDELFISHQSIEEAYNTLGIDKNTTVRGRPVREHATLGDLDKLYASVSYAKNLVPDYFNRECGSNLNNSLAELTGLENLKNINSRRRSPSNTFLYETKKTGHAIIK